MRRRVLYLLIAVTAAVLLFTKPFGSGEDLAEEIEATHRTLLKYRRAARETVGGAGLKESDSERGNLEKGLLPGPSPARTIARLQTEVSDLAARAGLSITSMRPVNPVDRPPYQEMVVQVNLNGTVPQLRDFLASLEQSHVLLRITTLTIRVNNVRTPDSLRVKVAIAGMVKV